MEIPHLKKLRNDISKNELAMLAFSNEDPAKVKKFAEAQDLNYTVLTDASVLSRPYSEVNAIPSSFFINPDGTIKLATMGLISLQEINAILNAEN